MPAPADWSPQVYAELRRLAAAKLAGERAGHSLDATALVHEAYLKLVGDRQFDGREHLLAAAAEAMRRVLVDQARARNAVKRGGGAVRVDLEPDALAAPAPAPAPAPDGDLLALDGALETLARSRPDHAKLVGLRFFAGMTGDEAAAVLGVSPATADRMFRYAKAWLRVELGAGSTGRGA